MNLVLPDKSYIIKSLLMWNDDNEFDFFKFEKMLEAGKFLLNLKGDSFFNSDYAEEDDEESFGMIQNHAMQYFYQLNKTIFIDGNVDCLDDLVKEETKKQEEKYIKFLALLMLSQEFFGVCTASTFYTGSDLSNVIEGSSIQEKAFMNIHIIHYMLHKKKFTGFFSLYDNSDLNNGKLFGETVEFGKLVESKLKTIIYSESFDFIYKPFFENWAKLDEVTVKDVRDKIAYSVHHGTHRVNWFANKIDDVLLDE